ncbi:MAG: serine hydrolase domain-containing protein [Saprospiraceae bacterium]|nr:serine hydrolase domain-containing protein [Saprospiraceae bacterium]
MKKNFALLLFIAVMIDFVKSQPSISSENERIEKINQLFDKWDRPDSPGAAVAIIKDGEITYLKGFGSANLKYDIPIDPKSTVFHLASVSKQFTAFAIATLAQQEKIKLDDDIRTYLPELPDFGKKITIRNILHHTSGLREQWHLLIMGGWRFDDVILDRHIMKLLSQQKELNFNPGEEFLYCNTGYTLATKIVEKVTGQSFPDWAKDNIFQPLGMNHTFFNDSYTRVIKNHADGYDDSSGEFEESTIHYGTVGPTSLQSTAEDLCRWVLNFETMKIGDEALMRQLLEKNVLNNGDTTKYAFGQFIDTYKGLRRIGHSGSDNGYQTYIGRFPDQHFSVIVLCNLATMYPEGLAMQIADIYLADVQSNENGQKANEGNNFNNQTTSSFDASSINLKNYTGTYYSEELNTYYTISISDGRLTTSHRSYNDIYFTFIDENHLRGSAWYFRNVEVLRNSKDKIVGLRVSTPGLRNLRFVKK